MNRLTRRSPSAASPGRYRTVYKGANLIVEGPAQVYPSGVRYFRVLEGSQQGRYIPATHLDWVEPLGLLRMETARFLTSNLAARFKDCRKAKASGRQRTCPHLQSVKYH